MSSTAEKLFDFQEEGKVEKGKTTREKIQNTLTDELIIGICAPIGSLKEEVIKQLSEKLTNQYSYTQIKIIKLSDFINQYSKREIQEYPKKTGTYNDLINKIEGGDYLRSEYSPACLAELAIQDIFNDRVDLLETIQVTSLKSRRTCYIIDSLKNTEELHTLRNIYNDIFYCFSIFSPLDERENNLINKGLSKDEVQELIQKDNHENDHVGQNVRETFVEGDFIIRVSKKNISTLEDKISRYLHLIFESSVVTPKPEEIAMYQAKSAAGNSACLSRQVGATITNEKGEIISRGWNDVPKFGGNLYKDGDSPDHRCMLKGQCSNDKEKNKIVTEIVSMVKEDPILGTVFKGADAKYAEEKIHEIVRRSSKVRDLIEFSRSVHAEMHAIIVGSQLSSNKMVGGKLFCTTYPCHNCARHIIVAGIKEIYYIEPYIKSLCLQLHSDAITEDENSVDKVKILIYDGVAPRRFLDFFTMASSRKDKNGDVITKKLTNIVPKKRLSLQAIPTLEQQAILSLVESGLVQV